MKPLLRILTLVVFAGFLAAATLAYFQRGEQVRADPPSTVATAPKPSAEATPPTPTPSVTPPQTPEPDLNRLLGPGYQSGSKSFVGGLSDGAGLGDAHGVGGLGPRETGPGGEGSSPGTGNRKEPVAPPIQGKFEEVGGALDLDVARKVLRRHEDELKQCAEQDHLATAHEAAVVRVRLSVGATGSVEGTPAVEVVEPCEGLRACVARIATRWRFPHPPGGAPATVSFTWSHTR